MENVDDLPAQMACSAIVGWSVMGDRQCALPTFANRLLLKRHFVIESRDAHQDIRAVPVWPREQAEELCRSSAGASDVELPTYTYAWWQREVPPTVDTRLIFAAYDKDRFQMRVTAFPAPPPDDYLAQLVHCLNHAKMAVKDVDEQIEKDRVILNQLEHRTWVVENMARLCEALDLRVEQGLERMLLSFVPQNPTAP